MSPPEGLAGIGGFAFSFCAAVDSIVLPASVSHIGTCPFSYRPQPAGLTIAEGNTRYAMDGLLLYSGGFDTLTL